MTVCVWITTIIFLSFLLLWFYFLFIVVVFYLLHLQKWQKDRFFFSIYICEYMYRVTRKHITWVVFFYWMNYHQLYLILELNSFLFKLANIDKKIMVFKWLIKSHHVLSKDICHIGPHYRQSGCLRWLTLFGIFLVQYLVANVRR